MQCIIPIAGPDFYSPDYGIKPLFEVDGVPLLYKSVTSRPWWDAGIVTDKDLIFALKESNHLSQFKSQLLDWFPRCRVITYSEFTTGALGSCFGAIPLLRDDDLLCIDLVDILYSMGINQMLHYFDLLTGSCVGLVPFFHSQDPCFSYLKVNEKLEICSVSEKSVTSCKASVGTYIFRNPQTFILGVYSSFTGRYLPPYITSVLNALVQQDLRILAVPVDEPNPLSLIFH